MIVSLMTPRRDDITDEEVLRLYNDEGLTAPAIAKRLRCGTTTIYRALDRNGVVASDRRRQRGYESKTFGNGEVIIRRYRAGETMQEIADDFGVNRITIRNALVRLGEPSRRPGGPKRTFTEAERQKVAVLREQGLRQEEIAKAIGTTQPQISQLLHEMGLERRRVQRNRRERIITKHGYAMVLLHPDDPFRCMGFTNTPYVMEHRIVMARHLGRVLGRTETVHHINGQRDDNRLENLQLRQGMHGKHAAFQCADCGSRNVVPTTLL